MASIFPFVSALDEEILESASTYNPYPGADKREWTDRFAAALAAGTDLPQSVAEAIAAYVTQPKQYLHRQEGTYRLRPEVLVTDGALQIMQVRVHGFVGSPGEYNERIRSSFDSPLRPGARPDYVLPILATGRARDNRTVPFLTTAEPVDLNRQARLLDHMEAALDDADGDRGYRLVEDIEVYGQKEVTLHAPFVRQIQEPTDTGTSIRAVLDLTAIKGANRSRARLALFGLTVKDIVFGFSPYDLMRVPRRGDALSADPTYWVPVLADLLAAAYVDPDHPGHKIAMRAANVATIPIQIIVGATNLDGFHTAVFDPNRVDHRRPPLDYKLTEKAASDLRAILRELANRGELDEQERAWLSGEGPDPRPVPDESLVDARDRRDRMLFSTVFPETKAEQTVIRQVLGEPAPSHTGRRHVDNRARMLSAVVNDGYADRWNPRVLDGLVAPGSIKECHTYPAEETWATLLDKAAQGDEDALEIFIVTRGMHWLAEHKIVEADRGSVEAQTGGTDEDETRRIRRSMTSILNTLKLNPAGTIGLMRELARATNARTKARQVGVNGEPVENAIVSRAWFDEAFPKVSQRRKAPPGPSDDPIQPEATPKQILLAARDAFESSVTNDLVEACANAFDSAAHLEASAVQAGHPAIPENLNDTLVQILGEALAAARQDVMALSTILQVLQHGGGNPEFFDSKCSAFRDQKADDGDVQ